MEAKLYHRDENDVISLTPVRHTHLPPVLFFIGQKGEGDDVELLEYINMATLPPDLKERVHEFVRENFKKVG